MKRTWIALICWLTLGLAALAWLGDRTPGHAPTSGAVHAYVPFSYLDSSGVGIVCVADRSSRLLPPLFVIPIDTAVLPTTVIATTQGGP